MQVAKSKLIIILCAAPLSAVFYLECAAEQVLDACLTAAMGGGSINSCDKCRLYADARQLSLTRPLCGCCDADRTDSVVVLLTIDVGLVYAPPARFIGERIPLTTLFVATLLMKMRTLYM